MGGSPPEGREGLSSVSRKGLSQGPSHSSLGILAGLGLASHSPPLGEQLLFGANLSASISKRIYF